MHLWRIGKAKSASGKICKNPLKWQTPTQSLIGNVKKSLWIIREWIYLIKINYPSRISHNLFFIISYQRLGLESAISAGFCIFCTLAAFSLPNSPQMHPKLPFEAVWALPSVEFLTLSRSLAVCASSRNCHQVGEPDTWDIITSLLQNSIWIHAQIWQYLFGKIWGLTFNFHMHVWGLRFWWHSHSLIGHRHKGMVTP